MQTGPRILVVGGDPAARQAVAVALDAGGFCPTEAAGPESAVARVGDFETAILLGADAPRVCAVVRASHPTVPILAVIPRNPESLVAVTYAAGADEVLAASELPLALLPARVLARVQGGRTAQELRRGLAERDALLETLTLVANEEDLVVGLREALGRAAELLGFERASILVVGDNHDGALVVCASDDPDIVRLPVDLALYPEVRAAISARVPVAAHDVTSDPIFQDRAGVLLGADVRSLAAFPIEWKGRPCGAVLYRSSRSGHALSESDLALGRIVARVLEARVGGGQLLEAAREQTHRLQLARYESERRLRAIEQLKAYFDAASDGVAVVDGDGVVLFVNRAAEAITGYARESLVGAPFGGLVVEEERDTLSRVITQVLGGQNFEPFDLHIRTTSGDPLCLSISTSTILAEHGAAPLSFRDVTAERALEEELRHTKEFLERLIDSAVDAIVAVEPSGSVLIFNRGAERLFGWTAQEAVGRIRIEELFPQGVAAQLLRALRSSAGGVGRTEITRREALARSGETVPVNMTAALILEEGKEVAIVMILSDLRERIRIEQRLLQAQQKLVITERQALVAQLAGTAAHELNQPLTSVMGYADLLRRRFGPSDPSFKAVDTIVREAERMAEIVKKVGQITHYETKAYVGSAQIIDLDRSTGPNAAYAGDEFVPEAVGQSEAVGAPAAEPVPQPVPEREIPVVHAPARPIDEADRGEEPDEDDTDPGNDDDD